MSGLRRGNPFLSWIRCLRLREDDSESPVDQSGSINSESDASSRPNSPLQVDPMDAVDSSCYAAPSNPTRHLNAHVHSSQRCVTSVTVNC